MIRLRTFTILLPALGLLAASSARAESLPMDSLPPYLLAQTGPTATPTPEIAATPAPTPVVAAAPVTTGATKLKIGGVLFALYSYDMSQGANGAYLGNKNTFDVSRAYINVEPSWGDGEYYARITPDLTRATVTSAGNVAVSTTGSLVERLKYAYFGHKLMDEVDMRAGLQQTCFVDFEESIWPYRVVNTIMADAFFGQSSSDMGFTSQGKIAGILNYHAGVFNGESFSKPEGDKFKEFQGRVTGTILKAEGAPGLRGTVYYSYAIKNTKPDADKARGILLVTYEHKMGTVGGEYEYGQDSNGAGAANTHSAGQSVWGFVNLPLQNKHMIGARVLLRVDNVDPNDKVKKDGTMRLIGGFAFRGTEKTQFILDYQQSTPEDSAKKPTQTAFAHWEAKF